MNPLGKKLYPFVILLAVAIGIFWGIHSRRKTPATSVSSNLTNRASAATSVYSPSTNRVPVATAPANASTDSIAPSLVPATPATTVNGPEKPYQIGSAAAPPSMDPMTLLGNVRHVINDYGSMFGGNPVGNNAEITAALNGDNPKGVKFLREDAGMRVNGQGELVDAWGTPFFFHQLSGTETEIRSAGPDRKMYTADDLVLK